MTEIVTPDVGNPDVAEARAVFREFTATLKNDPNMAQQSRAGLALAAEWFANITIGYLLIYEVRPAWLKVALLVPWSLYANFALDNIIHYASHWPLFKWKLANTFLMSGILVFYNPREIRRSPQRAPSHLLPF